MTISIGPSMPSYHKCALYPIWMRIVLIVAFALPAAHALGQETDARDPSLPDLAPREVEIRGQLTITFPSLQRQPLIGFNPPPRIPEVPLDRRPYIEPYKQESAELPPSPLQPPSPPPVSTLTGAKPNRGEFEAAAGKYLTRFVRIRTGIALTETADFTTKLDYRGSDGYTPFEQTLPNRKNPFDALEASASLQTKSSFAVTGATVDGFFENYSLYGLRSPVRSLFVPVPDREGRGGAASVWMRTQNNTAFNLDAKLRYGSTRYQTDVFADLRNEDPNFTRVENRLDFTGNLSFPLSSGSLELDTKANTTGLDTGSLLGTTIRSFSVGGGYRFLYGNVYRVRLGLRALGFEAKGQTQAGATRRAFYLSPDLRLDLYPKKGLNLYIQNHPSLVARSLGDLYRENPYLLDEPRMQPTLHTINAETGVRYFIGNFLIAGRAGFEEAPNYQYFESVDGRSLGTYAEGLTAVRYGKARIYRIGGESAFALTTRLHASVSLEARKGSLTELSADIPYFAPLTGTATLSYIFANDKGLIQTSTVYESRRYSSHEQTENTRVGAYLNLDIEASYQVSPWIGIVGRAENLIGGHLTRWANYPEIPASVMGGLRVRF